VGVPASIVLLVVVDVVVELLVPLLLRWRLLALVIVRFLLVLRLVPEEVLHHLVPRLLLHVLLPVAASGTLNLRGFGAGGWGRGRLGSGPPTGARVGVADYSPPTREKRNRRLVGADLSLSLHPHHPPPDRTHVAAGTAG
jgi:hypothetical protein